MTGDGTTDVGDMDTCLAWEAPEPHRRTMGVMFERDITPTEQLAAGFVRIPVGHEQPKLSRHPGEEVHFVVTGEGVFDRSDRRHIVRARGAVYVPPFSPHRWINVGDVDLEVFYVVSPSAFGQVGGYLDVVAGWERVAGTAPGVATNTR
jgi:mannose-6-phosphate isomerase-like protein (cupin superfamily)